MAICATTGQISNLSYRKETMHFTPPAYLDPGSGSFIIQIAIALLLGIGVAIRASWSKIQGWLGIKPKADDSDEDGETN